MLQGTSRRGTFNLGLAYEKAMSKWLVAFRLVRVSVVKARGRKATGRFSIA